MMRIKSRSYLLVAVAILIAGSLLFAQMPGPRKGMVRGPHAVSGEGNFLKEGPEKAIRIIARYLELSEGQIEIIQEEIEAAQEFGEPIRSEMQTARQALKTELEADNPSEAIVGSLVIQIHELRTELRENREAAVESVVGMLNQDQLDKLEAVKKAALLQPVVRAFHRLGLIPHNPRPFLEDPADEN